MTLVYLILPVPVTVERCVASHDVIGRNTSLPAGQSVVVTGAVYSRLDTVHRESAVCVCGGGGGGGRGSESQFT